LIQRALASDPPQLPIARLRAHVESALNAASDAARLAKEIGVYAGRDPLPPEPIWVHEALGTALLLVGPRIDHRGSFRFARTDDAQIVARSATLVRVFVNVIVELVEASLEPGAPHDVQIDTVLRGSELEIVITDASARWSPDAVAHSLAARDLVARSALRGLARARALLASIGGHLGVESDSGAGVTVLILLPTVHSSESPARYV
jgi:C4-dicarboxylate-specific signal transduction histidine kinase